MAGDLWGRADGAISGALRYLEGPQPFDSPGLWLAGGAGAVLLLTLGLRRLRIRSTRSCRWGIDRSRSRACRMDRWICRTCGVDAYSSDGRTPKECKRMLRSGRL